MFSKSMAQSEHSISRNMCERYNRNALICSRDVIFQLGSSLRISIVQLVFQENPTKKVTRSQIWRIVRPIHAISRVLWIIQASNTTIKVFVEVIENSICSMRVDTVLYEPGSRISGSCKAFCTVTNSRRVSKWSSAVIVWSRKNDPISPLEDIKGLKPWDLRDAGMMVRQHLDSLFSKCASFAYWRSRPVKSTLYWRTKCFPHRFFQHSAAEVHVRDCLACFNRSNTKWLACLNRVWKQVEAATDDTVCRIPVCRIPCVAFQSEHQHGERRLVNAPLSLAERLQYLHL